MDLAADVLSGDRLALTRLLTLVENNAPEGQTALETLFPHTGRAHLVGVTGAPGTGKSSLVNRLAAHYRKRMNGDPAGRVAVVAVDPSSPFTGGAIMGDRIRMRELAGDPGVFIRSMASRGALGGLARTTAGLVKVFDAAGYELIFVETVGAGQVEVDIARLAHTTLVVDAPGLGDDIQAIKAGIIEIADILVVNKYDRPGAERTVRALRNMLMLGQPPARTLVGPAPFEGQHPGEGQAPGDARGAGLQPPEDVWVPPVLQTIATEGEGIAELAAEIERHRGYLHETSELERRVRARLQAEMDIQLRDDLVNRWRARIPPMEYQRVLDRVIARQISPRQAVRILLDGGANE